jgi:multicomponent Na+:H+ antiporter subunit D
MSAVLAAQWALVVPVIGMVLLVLAGRWPNLREAVTLITAVVLFALVVSIGDAVMADQPVRVHLIEIMPGLSLDLAVEPLGWLFSLIASGLWIVNSLYSIGYMRGNNEANQTRFFACFAGALAAAIGIAYAANLLTLFFFYEMLTLITYPLVTHHGTEKAKRGGRIYLGILIGTSILFLLTAIVWTWAVAGTLEFQPGGILAGKVGGTTLAILLGLYLFGIGKAALMPFHLWLPSAMVAPTPVSALLHAVAVVKAGVFSVVKVVVYVFGIDTLAQAGTVGGFAAIAAFTIIAASIVALRADNLKRRLAYSTVSQLSYVVLAAVILSPISMVGAALHIAAHAFGKITLFFAAGAIYTAAHKTEVSQLDGIGRRMPWTMTAFAIGALSMIGLPPTAGFISKWYILTGAMSAEHWLAVGTIVASTLLNAGYFMPIIYRAFFCAERVDHGHDDHGHAGRGHGEAPLLMVIALVTTASLTVLMFFQHEIPLALGQKLLGG